MRSMSYLMMRARQTSMVRQMPLRAFSASQASDFKDLHEELFYSPERKVDFGSSTEFTVFDYNNV